MIEKVKALKERHRKAQTEQEFQAIKQETEALIAQDPEAWAKAMLESMQQTKQELKNLLVREQLQDVLQIVSASYLAKTYFNKTPQWFYQRLNGNLVNGKPAQFTPQEIEILNNALHDISQKIGAVSVTL